MEDDGDPENNDSSFYARRILILSGNIYRVAGRPNLLHLVG